VIIRRHAAALDSIPFDQLSPAEKVNAQIFRTAIGSVPLPVLEQRMTQFIVEESAAAKD